MSRALRRGPWDYGFRRRIPIPYHELYWDPVEPVLTGPWRGAGTFAAGQPDIASLAAAALTASATMTAVPFVPGPVEVAAAMTASGKVAVYWTPWALGAAVYARYDAASLTSGAAVASWPTTQGGGPTLAQATPANQPVQSATGFNGSYPGVIFDGAADWLGVESAAGLPAGATTGEIWTVAGWGAPTALNQFLFGYGHTTVASVSRNVRRHASGFITITDGAINLTDSPSTTVVPAIVRGRWDTTLMSGWADGLPLTVASVAIPTLATGTTRVRLGCALGNTPNLFFPGAVRCVLVTGLLSNNDADRMTGFLAHESGLAGTLDAAHPYKTAPPLL